MTKSLSAQYLEPGNTIGMGPKIDIRAPIVSIITPLFNKRAFIGETIKSVLAQTLADWEMIVVDDASTDGSAEVVRLYAAQDRRIRLWERTNEKGPGSARNHGVALAKGSWVLFLDADDLIESSHLERLTRDAHVQPAVKIIAGSYRRFPDNQPSVFTQIPPAGLGLGKQDLLDYAIAFGAWAPHAAIVSRDILFGQFLWDEKDFFGEDTAFWFRLLCFHTPGFSDNHGALYRYLSADCKGPIPNRRRGVVAIMSKSKKTLPFWSEIVCRYPAGNAKI